MSLTNSLHSFLNETVLKYIYVDSFKDSEIKVLEIGCGNRSIFENEDYPNFKVYAIDSNIEKISCAPESKVHYSCNSIICLNQTLLEESFDLVFDSHAIHCILDLKDRESAFKNIYHCLRPQGLFASEMMVRPIDLDNFEFFPDRFIISALKIENELLDLGFKIKYFYISPDLFFEDGSGTGRKCDVLRFIAQK